MVYVKVNDTMYAASILGRMADKEWDGRESKAIKIEFDFDTVNALFPDGTAWSIVDEHQAVITDEEGNPILNENGAETYFTEINEFDNSEYSIRGDLIVHTDGTCTVKMGKKTDVEILEEENAKLLFENLTGEEF